MSGGPAAAVSVTAGRGRGVHGEGEGEWEVGMWGEGEREEEMWMLARTLQSGGGGAGGVSVALVVVRAVHIAYQTMCTFNIYFYKRLMCIYAKNSDGLKTSIRIDPPSLRVRHFGFRMMVSLPYWI